MPHTFEPAVPVHTYQRIVDQIEAAILNGTIAVGTQLASERDLMQQFGVSRPTVREALRVLQSMGLLESKPGTRGGPQVIAPSATTLHRSFRAMVRTDALQRAELVQYRVILDGSACELAALNHDNDDAQRLDAAITAMEQAAQQGSEEFIRADTAFHEAIWEASGNSIVHMSGQAVADALHDLMAYDAELSGVDTAAQRAAVAIDRTLCDAILARDALRAGTIARRAIATRFAGLLDTPSEVHALNTLARIDED